MPAIANEQHIVDCLEGDGARELGTQLFVEPEQSFLREAVLQQEWGMLGNQHLVRSEDPRLAMCEFVSLYLQHKLREPFATE